MKAFNPTAEQERCIEAASRLHLSRDLPWVVQRAGGWIAPSTIARCAFFVLGVVAGGLTGAVFELLHGAVFVAGLVMLIAAETLIRRKHLFHAGIEEALWAGGLLAVVLDLMEPPGGSGVSAAIFIALTLAIAGMRLLNPLFTALAAVAASVAIDLAGGHRLIGEPSTAIAPGVFCYGAGALALLAGRMQIRRPSHDHMLDWLVVSMPLCGFLWLAAEHPASGIRVLAALLSLGMGIAALMIGLRRRTHAPLLSFLVCAGCLAYELRDLTALPLKLKLIMGGSAVLVAAVALERYLRTPRRGITSVQVGEGSHALEILQLAGVAMLSPKAAPAADGQFKGQGGSFSGGGADGSY
jgi:hypothetical protein